MRTLQPMRTRQSPRQSRPVRLRHLPATLAQPAELVEVQETRPPMTARRRRDKRAGWEWQTEATSKAINAYLEPGCPWC